MRDAFPTVARLAVGSERSLFVALGAATLAGVAAGLWTWARPTSVAAIWAILLVQAVVALNVVSHVVTAAFLFDGYGPGLATALLFNLPLSVHAFRRATRERWLTPRALLALLPAAVLVHGPLLFGLLVVAVHLTRQGEGGA